MAKIPVGLEYSQTLKGETLVEFHCRRCSHSALAMVRSQGEGSGTAWAFLGTDSAKARASEGAQTDFTRNAEALASAAPCPKCAHADTVQTEGARGAAAMKGVGLFVLTLLFGLFSKSSFAMLVPLLGLVGGFITYATSSWKWDEVSSRVRFVTREQAEAALLSMTAGHSMSTTDWVVSWLWKKGYDDVVSEPFVGALRLGLLSTTGGEGTWIEASDLGSALPRAALAEGHKNLAGNSEKSLRQVEPNVWQGDWGDWYAASRLVVVERFTALNLDGDPIAFTPSENTLFVAGANDEAGLLRAATLAEAHAREVIANHPQAGAFCATPWRRTKDTLEPWIPPLGHPLGAKLESIAELVGSKGWTPE